MLKIFKNDNDNKRLWFMNIDRLDEEIIFNEARVKLEEHRDIRLLETVMEPYNDTLHGTYKDMKFDLVLDLNYGAYVFSENKDCLLELEKIFIN